MTCLGRLLPAASTITAAALLLAGGAWATWHGDLSNEATLVQFYGGVVTMGAGFLIGLRLKRIPWAIFWVVAIGVRVVCLPMTPGVDVYRYIWEGHIQNHGFEPYTYAPDSEALVHLRNGTWERVVHKNISAIYPPLTEVGFRVLAAASLSPLLFKLTFFGADLLICLLLARRFGACPTVLYAWNPLVIYSFSGAAHYDSWFVLCLVAAWLVWERGRPVACAGLLGMAVAIKWIALPILCWHMWRVARERGWRRTLRPIAAAALPFLLTWPLATNGNLAAPLFSSEFALYARSSELVPALVSWLWPEAFPRNTVYLFALAAVTLWLLIRSRDLLLFCERYLLALLILSPMVHVWYFTWLIPFAVGTRNLGTIAVSVTGFAYFGIPAVPGLLENRWLLLLMERGLVWLPLMVGLAVTLWKESAERRRSKAISIAGAEHLVHEFRNSRNGHLA
jgi:hypothetical protein